MNSHEFRPVWKRPLDLHLVNHRGDALDDILRAEQLAADVHQLGHRLSVADELEQLGRDERDRLRIVEAEAACEPLLRQHPGLVQHKLVYFPR